VHSVEESQAARRWLDRVATGCALIVVGLAVASLVSVILDVELHHSQRGGPRMSPATAVACVLAGTALWMSTQVRTKLAQRATRTLAQVVVAFGVARLLTLAIGVQLGVLGGPLMIDAGVTAPATAVGLALSGISLSRSNGVRPSWLPDVAALCGCLVGWLGLSRYVYGGGAVVGFAQMSAPTSFGLAALGLGAMCSRRGGLATLITGGGSASVIARRLMRVALTAPFLFGLLYLHGLQRDWWSMEAGVSLLTFALSAGVCGTAWWAAARLERADRQRTTAEHRVRDQLDRMHLLHEISEAMARRQDVKSTEDVVATQVFEQFGADLVVLLHLDLVADELTIKSVRSALSSEQDASWLVVGQGIAVDNNGLARCVSGELVYEPDISDLPHPISRKLGELGIRSMVLASLRADSETLGVLLVASKRTGRFKSTDCEFFRQLGVHVALSIRQSHLHQCLSEAYEDLRNTREAMSKQERLAAVGQLASGIAHDINNALSPVGMYAFMMLEEERNLSDAGREALETIRKAVDDVGETLARFRRFYKAPGKDFVSEELALNFIVDETIEMSRPRWMLASRREGVEVTLERELAGDLPTLTGNSGELRDAITNLLINAIDAMPNGGTLSVRTMLRKADDGSSRIVLEVADTGVGMDEATRERCVEPFFTTKGELGTGLGMAMVHSSVQRHGGVLEIDSVVGSGTTVRMSFPTSSQVAQVKPSEDVQPRPVRLLVVDDDPVILRALETALDNDGHDVVLASGGREALRTFLDCQSGAPFDGIITDYGMPHLDGASLAAAVKKSSPDTPVLMLSGWGVRLNEERSTPPHVDAVLSKPLKVPALRQLLARYFGAIERKPQE